MRVSYRLLNVVYAGMKILEANTGVLTNFEVLDGASKDPTRVLVKIAPSEFKVYDYLVERSTSSDHQTIEKVNEFVEMCKKLKLAKAEVLNMINIRPSSLVEIHSIAEECYPRLEEEQLEELVTLVTEVLPLLQNQENTEEVNKEDNDITADCEAMDDS